MHVSLQSVVSHRLANHAGDSHRSRNTTSASFRRHFERRSDAAKVVSRIQTAQLHRATYSGKPKIRHLDPFIRRDQQILTLQIAMNAFSRMQVRHRACDIRRKRQSKSPREFTLTSRGLREEGAEVAAGDELGDDVGGVVVAVGGE